MDLARHIHRVPDFQKPGNLCYDVSTLLAHSGAWCEAIDPMVEAIRPMQPDTSGRDRKPWLLGRRSAGSG